MKQIQYVLILFLLPFCSGKIIAMEPLVDEIEIDSCTMLHVNKKISLIKRQSYKSIYLPMVIYSIQSSQENKMRYSYLVEDSGFGSLLCGDSSFSIIQDISIDPRYDIQEQLVFSYNEEDNVFYLTHYQQYKTDKQAFIPYAELTEYPKKEIGLLSLQELTLNENTVQRFRERFWIFSLNN